MTTMYIACNNSKELGIFLGDILTLIKTAWLFIENEPHDNVILSLMQDEPLNFLWYRFITMNNVKVVYDTWNRGDKDTQYKNFEEREQTRIVHNIKFDTYKELYPRLDGGNRQGYLCKKENGLGRRNIFEYNYFGQQTYCESVINSVNFDDKIVHYYRHFCKNSTVFIAPEEKCQGNRIFTLEFWLEVALKLSEYVKVHINSTRSIFTEIQNTNIKCVFPSYPILFDTINQYELVLCGNTGIGWVAAATNTPYIAMEKSMILGEYSFKQSGCVSLINTITEPDSEVVVFNTLNYLKIS